MTTPRSRPLLPVFLDFDGTLHPLWRTERRDTGREVARSYEGPWLVEAPQLDRILAPYYQYIELVIASTWAYERSLDAIRDLLPRRLAGRTIDSIWIQEIRTPTWSAYADGASRYRCIELWLQHRRPTYDGPWLAIDDDARGWPDSQREKLVHAAGTLANPSVQSELAARLSKLFSDRAG